MIKAHYSEKRLVIDILAESFDTNKSVNYVVGQGEGRLKRIRNLMDYSFEICYRFGAVYLSEDKAGCLLVVYPDKKKTTIKTIWLAVKLLLSCVGLSRMYKVVAREAKIKKYHPVSPMYYVWFIGVRPDKQRSGVGSGLLREAIQESILQNKSIYLETSTVKNLPWYQKFGFTALAELQLTFPLFLLKRDTTV